MDLKQKTLLTYYLAGLTAKRDGMDDDECLDFASWVVERELSGKRKGEPLPYLLLRYCIERAMEHQVDRMIRARIRELPPPDTAADEPYTTESMAWDRMQASLVCEH